MTADAKAGAVNYILTRKITPNVVKFGADGPAIEAAMKALGEQFKLAPIPATAYHGDANAGNFMVNNDGTVGVIDFDKMQWSLNKQGEGIDTGAADLARFGQSLETLHPGKLTTAEADALRAAFEKAYFDAMAGTGVTPAVLDAAKKMYAVETEIAAMNAGKYTPAQTAERIKAILGI
jgi:tRNA A-37 threonylcarbamoyl transferase component Bud32